MPDWRLQDAAILAAAHPYTFFKSPLDTIALLKPGDVAKLIFLLDSDDPKAPNAERMWVLIDTIDADGQFTGRLNNEPEWIRDLTVDDTVVFHAAHIINTEYDDDDNLVERYIKRCYVSRRVLEEGARVGYLYREAPDNDRDSGWRITANDESDDYMNQSKNFAFVSLGLVLSKDDSFIHLLDAPEGASYVFNAHKQAFVPCVER